MGDNSVLQQSQLFIVSNSLWGRLRVRLNTLNSFEI